MLNFSKNKTFKTVGRFALTPPLPLVKSVCWNQTPTIGQRITERGLRRRCFRSCVNRPCRARSIQVRALPARGVVTRREERRGRDVACDRSPELSVVVSCSDAGCIPLFLMAAAASGEAKNRRNCFAIASCFELTTTPPEKTSEIPSFSTATGDYTQNGRGVVR